MQIEHLNSRERYAYIQGLLPYPRYKPGILGIRKDPPLLGEMRKLAVLGIVKKMFSKDKIEVYLSDPSPGIERYKEVLQKTGLTLADDSYLTLRVYSKIHHILMKKYVSNATIGNIWNLRRKLRADGPTPLDISKPLCFLQVFTGSLVQVMAYLLVTAKSREAALTMEDLMRQAYKELANVESEETMKKIASKGLRGLDRIAEKVKEKCL